MRFKIGLILYCNQKKITNFAKMLDNANNVCYN